MGLKAELRMESIIAVQCQGEPWQMGLAQGGALPEKIRGAYDALRDIEAFRIKQPWWLPFSLFRRKAAASSRRSLAPAVAAGCPSASQRLLGIAHGARVGEDSLWLIQAMEGLLASVDGNTDILPPGGCSAVAIRGRMSSLGEPVIAHNFDYLPLVQPFYIVRESGPNEGYRSIEFTAAPLAGAIDGVNELGLAVTYNYAQTVDKDQARPTISMRLSEVLARFGTVTGAIEWLTCQPCWGSGLLMLADRRGDIASVELSNTKEEVRRPKHGEDYLFHANKFQCPRTVEVEVHPDAVYNARAPKPLRGHRVLESSLRRMDRFAVLLGGAGPLGLDQLGAIMADHAAGSPSDSTICMHSDYWTTTACVQCLPWSRTLRVSFSSACQANYVEFTL
jgi:hypothetical protein